MSLKNYNKLLTKRQSEAPNIFKNQRFQCLFIAFAGQLMTNFILSFQISFNLTLEANSI